MNKLLSSADLTRADIEHLFTRADHFTRNKSVALKDKFVGLLFFENSSRTRVSFEAAALRMGAQTILITSEGSSLQKGETELDTARIFSCNGADILVVRTGQEGMPAMIAAQTGLPVINAGEACIDHPSQGLLDAYTLRQHFGDLKDKIIAIVGDVKHSRVAASNAIILQQLGAQVRFVAPAFFLPNDAPCACFTDIEKGLENADAVMALRVQKERFVHDIMHLKMNEYAAQYGLTKANLAHAKSNAVVLHPMPMNRGVEIADDVADGTHSLVYKQMQNGLFIRMAMYEAVL